MVGQSEGVAGGADGVEDGVAEGVGVLCEGLWVAHPATNTKTKTNIAGLITAFLNDEFIKILLTLVL